MSGCALSSPTKTPSSLFSFVSCLFILIQKGGMATGGVSIREEEKIPLFLVKLWNIIEDAQYSSIVRWDESGCSFHIVDPYSFSRNVLPQYFKHNNLNSLIRQLNMYGFRKMTPIERSGLARSESDQDHLEFSHPYFVRDHPELLANIKRKTNNQRPDSAKTHDLGLVLDELHQLREKQRNMENKMNHLVKENEAMWTEVSHVRSQHMKQQQVVNKLVQFLIALVQPTPGQQKRVGKRPLLAIDEVGGKRARTISSSNLSEALDRLQRELLDNRHESEDGPIIADVTEELDQPVVSSHQSTMSNGQQARQPVPLLTLSPSLERQISHELSEYLTGVDQSIENCRDLLGNHWDFDFLQDPIEQQQESLATQQRLMLEAAVPGDANSITETNTLNEPGTPDLLTPSTSPRLV